MLNRDRDIDKELQFHLDQQRDAYIAEGLPRDEAERRARLDFGGLQQVREEVRAVGRFRWIEDVVRDVQFAARTFRRMPAFATTAVITLALGIGMNTALFTVVREVLLKSLPVANSRELVEIDCSSARGAAGAGPPTCMQSYPAYRVISGNHPGLAGVFAFAPVPSGAVAVVRGAREVITAQMASGNTFDVLGLRPAVGRLLMPADDQPGAELVAVLSHSYWLRAFGGQPDAVGQFFALRDRSVRVVGILPPAFRGVTLGELYDVWLPLGSAAFFRGPTILSNGNIGWLNFMGRLAQGVSPEQVATALEPVFKQATEEALAGVPASTRRQLNLRTDTIRVDVRRAAAGATSTMRMALEPTLGVVGVVAILVLLIACANLAGLFLAQALTRQKEFGVRRALGASRGRLARQVLTEGLLVAIAGGSLGFLLAQWIAPAGFALAVGEAELADVDLSPNRWMLAFTASVAIATGTIVAAGSVLRAANADPQEALRKSRLQGSPRLTKILLTAQIALTIVLVGTAALFLQTLENFRRVDVGFQRNHLLIAALDPGAGSLDAPRFRAYIAEVHDALAAIPGVRDVTFSNIAPGSGISTSLMLEVPGFNGPSTADATAAGLTFVGPGFVRTVGMTLLDGRDIAAADDASAPRVAIVNESFATHFFGTSAAVGRTFATAPAASNPYYTIVGIVRDARDRGVKRQTERIAYLAHSQSTNRSATFTLRTAVEPDALAATVRQTIEELDPAVGVARIRTIDAQFEEALRRERLLATLGAAFAALALLLLTLGLYAMLNGLVVRRTNEIGIHMALGASGSRIALMLARETVAVVALGLIAGFSGYVFVGRLVQSQLFGVTPVDARAVGLAVITLLVTTCVAVVMPARRAFRIDPTDALRHDYA